MRLLPFAAACLVACVWLNQGRSLQHTDALFAESAVHPADHVLDRLRAPLLFLYRRSADEELYFNVASAIRGLPYDRATMVAMRANAPASFRRLPEADGRWHRPYADVPLEYPAVMLPFILAPELLAPSSFERFGKVFGVLMACCLLAGAALAMRAQPWRREPARAREGWWLVAAMLLAQGGLAIQRLDAVPAFFLAVALWAAVTRRPATLGFAMGLAVAAKLVPALLLPPLLLADRAFWGEKKAMVRLGAGLLAATALGFAPMLVTPDALADVIRYHAQRGLHVESTYGVVLGVYRTLTGTVTPSTLSFGSWNLDGAAAGAFARVSTALTVLGIGALSWWVSRAQGAGEAGIGPGTPCLRARADRVARAMLAALAIFWLTAKVFSPQYLTWAIPLAPALSGARGRRIGWLLVACMAVTQIYLRGYYDHVTEQRPLGMITMVVRLATLGALLWFTLRPSPASERAHDAAVTA
jgi:hypothetical protein